MSFHEQDSDVGRLNRFAAQRAVRVHPWTLHVLRRARRLHGATDGLFDISVAPALVRGGWLPRHYPLPRHSGTASDIAIRAGGMVFFRRPLLIDLSGIAKGFAVDCAVAALRGLGATSGIVNAGGDLRMFGTQTEPVHLRTPNAPDLLVPLLSMREGALATSAHYFAYRRFGGKRVSPIYNPHTRRLAGEKRSVTVVAPECWLADALCKVVWLAGNHAAPLLEKLDSCAFVLDAKAGKRIKRETQHHAA